MYRAWLLTLAAVLVCAGCGGNGASYANAPAKLDYRGISVSIRVTEARVESGGMLEVAGAIHTDRPHKMYNAHWDPKKPAPGRLVIFDERGKKVLELYSPWDHVGSYTGATRSACKAFAAGQAQQFTLRQPLLFNRSAQTPLPPGQYSAQVTLNGLILWEPDETRPLYERVPDDLDQQVVARSKPAAFVVVAGP